ncbi:MAG: nicotinate (nicotinamide) nucleotide adenylyltransferase [Oscillospiraceae bacterium]|nr:nicotinate (nicotinamide) nucleotide adenylyltransferase [Oscillospiraceae bacterium]
MKVAIYGGSFNPPHLGHLAAANCVNEQLAPDVFLIIPDNIPPHKEMEEGSPGAQARLEMARLNFADIENAVISDMEICRSGKSYTADTVARLRELYPEDELVLTIGTDMFLSFEEWYMYPYLLEQCTLAVVSRNENELDVLEEHKAYLEKEYSARVEILEHEALPMSSNEIRELLRLRMGADMLSDSVYSDIIRNGYYEAAPELSWLRDKVMPYLSWHRVAHATGCESESVKLAMHYGEDAELAAEAAILHDITKKLKYDEQLILCREYGIICDKAQLENEKLLHALTGAALAADRFGVCEAVREAIRWHTTGKPDMSILEKIIYLADYIEPTRDFEGVEKLRELAYENLDEAMILGLEMGLEELSRCGIEPHKDSAEALNWYKNRRNELC